MNINNEQILKYSVGALMYTPALNTKIADAVINGKYGKHFSLALDLEDTIAENAVFKAERQLLKTLTKIAEAKENDSIELPLLFIRVRNPEHLMQIYLKIHNYADIVTGFILPKYDTETMSAYTDTITEINDLLIRRGLADTRKVWFMPTLESGCLFNPMTRLENLERIKDSLTPVKNNILNIRVGGNDMCNAFGIRRNAEQTIYDIAPVNSLLTDILTVFSNHYVISAPVWEYFIGDKWKDGLRREIECDKLNGFIGKTLIHPNQLPVALEAFKVTREDYNDAVEVLKLSDGSLLVGKTATGGRMNEAKTHTKWAEKTLLLAKIYGVRL